MLGACIGPPPPPATPAAGPEIVCRRLSQRDCEGLVAVAQTVVPAQPSAIRRIVAEPDCAPGATCAPGAARTWVVFVLASTGERVAVFLVGDPSAPPRATLERGPLPAHVEALLAGQ